MRYVIRLVTVLAGALSLLVGTPAVLARADEGGDGGTGAVFVQTNDPAGNSIDVFARGSNGSLTYVASYPTGGNGARAAGATVDSLASQSSLVYDREEQLLLAVNAGSNTVSAFSVDGTRLHLNQVIASGGSFPNSIGIHGDLAYVLDAGLTGSVQGYRIDDGRLYAIPGSLRSLNLASVNPLVTQPAPAQVGFTPDGRHLVVTLKANNGGSVDVFNVARGGRLSAEPTNTVVGGNAFAFTFDPAGQLALVNAAFGNISTYTINGAGSLTLVSAGPSDGQKAACWVTSAGGQYFAANAGSGDLSEYGISGNGTVTLENATAATGIPASIDMAASSDGHFLYAQSAGSQTVKAFAVNADGSVSPIGSWPIPDGASQQGIAAA